jgi:adenylate cyclase class 2
MREIEVKARLQDKLAFMTEASKIKIEFGDVIEQDDTTYVSDIPHEDPNWNIFRIRKQNGQTILTMKHKASDRRRDNHEYETEVDDEVEIIKMLNRLGYERGVQLFKKRRIAHYGKIELCFDEIENLGTFVEAESLAEDDANVDAIQDELWSLLKRLGVDASDRVFKGYDTLMSLNLADSNPRYQQFQ